MCGRFAQPRSADDLARIFNARPATELDGDRFNVAPTDPVAAVLEHYGERLVDAFRWGLVPAFAGSPRGAARLINARSETAASSPAFRTSLRRRRCIVPADAFYEWRRDASRAAGAAWPPQPFAIRLHADEPMALAGIWAVWRDPRTAEPLHTVSILTTTPNALVAAVHDRMPVILERGDWAAWLDRESELDELMPMLRPAPADTMRLYPISPAVNDVRSQGPELLAPLSGWQSELWPA